MIQLVFFKRPFLLICWEFHTCIWCILTNSTLWLPPSSLQIRPANLILSPCCCLLVALVLLPFFFLLLSSSSSFSKCNPVSQISSAHMCILRATHQRMDPEKWHTPPATASVFLAVLLGLADAIRALCVVGSPMLVLVPGPVSNAVFTPWSSCLIIDTGPIGRQSFKGWVGDAGQSSGMVLQESSCECWPCPMLDTPLHIFVCVFSVGIILSECQ